MSDYTGRQFVVVYFYPKDNTPGCTKEACGFRDSYEDFKAMGAEVIGISTDGESSHRSFSKKHNLPFVLLSDPGGEVRKRFGVSNTLGLLPGRTTFIIDKHRIVRHVFNSQFQFSRHVTEAIDFLNKIK